MQGFAGFPEPAAGGSSANALLVQTRPTGKLRAPGEFCQPAEEELVAPPHKLSLNGKRRNSSQVIL